VEKEGEAMSKKLKLLTECSIRKGGHNPLPSRPKPKTPPPGQGGKKESELNGWRKKNRDIAEKINTMLDMREILKLKGDIMKSADGKIKIYKPELDTLRIDIKELEEDEK